MDNLDKERFLEIVTQHKLYGNPRNLNQYLDVLFGDLTFDNKRFLDIGGGTGVFTHYAAFRGAKEAVCMEPEFDGSTAGVSELFNKVTGVLGFEDISRLDTRLLQDFEGDPFDLILSHNSINHLNEEDCENILVSKEARQNYIEIFKQLYQLTRPGGTLIVCDCGRKNLFGDLGITNPVMKTIEWEKHQEPRVWADLLEEAGFTLDSISWNTFNSLGKIGPLLLGYRIPSYLTLSHFRIVLHREN